MVKNATIPLTGAKVHSYSVRSVKEVEKLRIVLEIDCDEITSDIGDVQKALYTHKKSDTEVGITLLVRGDSVVSVSIDSDDFDV